MTKVKSIIINKKCPHCRTAFIDNPKYKDLMEDINGEWYVVWQKCPDCDRIIIYLANGVPYLAARGKVLNIKENNPKFFLIYPKGSSRSSCPLEVPKEFSEDYIEACLVLTDSPKALKYDKNI